MAKTTKRKRSPAPDTTTATTVRADARHELKRQLRAHREVVALVRQVQRARATADRALAELSSAIQSDATRDARR